jgi:serine/threonine protein kinase
MEDWRDTEFSEYEFHLKELEKGNLMEEILNKYPNDKRMAMIAVKKRASAFKLLSLDLQHDLSIIHQAVRYNGYAIKYAPKSIIKENPMIFIEAFNTSSDFLSIFDYSFLNEIVQNIRFKELDFPEILLKIFEYGHSKKNGDAAYELGMIHLEGEEKNFLDAKIYFEKSMLWGNEKSKEEYLKIMNLLKNFNSDEIKIMENKSNRYAYKIVEYIARGAQGTVFKAKNKRNNQIVAIKKIQIEIDEINSSLKEVIPVVKLNHANICEIYDFFTEEDEKNECYYFNIVMPHCKTNLKSHVQQSTMDESLMIDYLKQITKGLEYIHRNGIIHRDMKPENILMDQDSTLLIADFGLSCQSSMKSMRKTKVGTLSTHLIKINPKDYCSPELLIHQSYSFPSDLFSLGGILYFLMTKKEIPLYLYSSQRNFKEIRQEIENYSQKLQDLLMNLISLNPNDRMSTSEVLKYLNDDGGEILKTKTQFIPQTIQTECSKGEEYNRSEILLKLKKDEFFFHSIPKELQKDKEFIIEAMKGNPKILHLIPEELLNDKPFIQDCMGSNEMALIYLQKDKAFVKETLKINGNLYKFIDSEFKHDKEIILLALKSSGYIVDYIPTEFLNDKEVILGCINNGCTIESIESITDVPIVDPDIILEYLKQYPSSYLTKIPQQLMEDREFILRACQFSGKIYEHISQEFQNDEEIIFKSVRSDGWMLNFVPMEHRLKYDVIHAAVCSTGNAYNYIPSEFIIDTKIGLEIIKSNGSLISVLPHYLRNNKEIIEELIEEDVSFFSFASDELKEDEEFILKLVKKHPKVLLYSNLKNEKEFVKKCIRLNGNCFSYLNDQFQNEKEIILEVVKSSPLLLCFVPKEHQNDRNIALEAITKNPLSIQYASEELKDNEVIAMECVSINGDTLKFFSPKIRNNIDIVAKAVSNSPNSWKYASNEIKSFHENSNYEMIEKIAEGSEGMVFKVKRNEVCYAQKNILLKDDSNITDMINDILKSFIVIQKLNHQHIYQIEDVFQSYNPIIDIYSICVIMKYYQGNLMEFIEQNYPKGLPEELIVDFLIQLVSGLMYIHKNGIIHQDLKPENIFYEMKENSILLKIGDFRNSIELNDDSKVLGSLCN